jgi:hypothetical protein
MSMPSGPGPATSMGTMLPRPVIELLDDSLGIVTRPALLALGFSADVVDGWVRDGHLERVEVDGVPMVGTYRVPGGARPPAQRAHAAVARCRPNAALTGPVMLAAHGIEGFHWEAALMVRVPIGRRVTGVPFTVLPDPLFHRHRETVDGLAGSSVTRAAIDTALVLKGKPLVTALDCSRWKRGGTSAEKLLRCATSLSRLGHAGAEEVLRQLDSGELDQESHGERALKPVLLKLGLRVRWQVWVTPRRRVDAELEGTPIVLEYLGRRAHAGSLKHAQDEARHRELLQAGRYPIYVVKADLEQPELLHSRIAAARDALASGIATGPRAV